MPNVRRAKVFVDASVLIFLSKADQVDILRRLYGKVYVTKEVQEEVLRGKGRPKAIVAQALGQWILVVDTGIASEELRKDAESKGLGMGEYSLVQVHKKGDVVILANGRAERKIREDFRIPVKDILDVGIEASKKGIIALRDYVKAIYQKGYRTRRVREILRG